MVNKMKILNPLSLSPLLFLGHFATAQIAVDDDNASRPVYDDGIQNFDNGSTTGGGTGFGGWVFSGTTPGNFDIASGTSNGGAGTIDVSSESFRLWDTDASGDFVDVFRSFDGGDLGVGQTFSFQMDVNFRDGFKGVRLRDTDDSTSIFRFEVGNPGSGDDYFVYDAATNNGSIGNTYSDDTTFTLVFTQTALTNGEWFITREGGVNDFDSGTYSGRISSFQLFTTQAGNNVNNAILYNNFSIVPEPGTYALLLGCSVMAWFALRRRF